ncbi:DNA invertase Pin-like site-specific DNA recombinase [Methanohalophilus levihalophilus]|uniref:recombinase family protein n=1 Tax=Methanohalophilus levihalophilus TaxID=1431282 RepID=UPI001AE3D605|nr:recombinase family protein [Methanohalophilus levihalophilus]MBP2029759.1 DNA invertase Pin-like site-specific DNA recombinase [Methanohalophilus levihalophilus]
MPAGKSTVVQPGIHNPGKVAYARVSADHQNLDSQLDALVSAGFRKNEILVDVESGTHDGRKAYQDLCELIRKGNISEVWVYRIDRLGRNHYELVSFLKLLEDSGCELISLCEPFVKEWRSFSWAFRATWEALGDARYELMRLKERQKAGITAAKGRGKHLGRPRKKKS